MLLRSIRLVQALLLLRVHVAIVGISTPLVRCPLGTALVRMYVMPGEGLVVLHQLSTVPTF